MSKKKVKKKIIKDTKEKKIEKYQKHCDATYQRLLSEVEKFNPEFAKYLRGKK